MRFVLFAFTLFLMPFLSAQTEVPPDTSGQEVELKVGDSMEIGSCAGEYFQHIDYFKKTRFSDDKIAYDTATGQGFYKSFFTTGDFDAAELPAAFSGRRFAIMGMEVLANTNTGKEMGILYLRGPDPHSVIWVDFSEALEAGELGLPGQVKK